MKKIFTLLAFLALSATMFGATCKPDSNSAIYYECAEQIVNEAIAGIEKPDLSGIKGDIDYVIGEVDRTQDDVRELQTLTENNKNSINDLNAKVEQNTSDIADNKGQIESVKDRVDKVEQDVAGTKSDLVNLSGKVEQNRNDIDYAIGEIDRTQDDVRELQTKTENTNADVADLKNWADKVTDDVKNAKDDIATNKENIDKVDSKIENVKSDVEKNKTDIANNTTQINKNTTTITKVQETVQVHTERLNRHEERLNRMESELGDFKSETRSGIAGVAAMTAIDFDSVGVSEVGIGAGVGGFKGKQAVAVGVAYRPDEATMYNFKVSGVDSNVVYSAGFTYKFKIK